MKERADQQMEEMVEQGIVEEVHGYCRYMSPGFFIAKRDTEKLRLVIDYQEANKYVKPIKSELPSIYDTVITLPRSKFIVLDIRSAFYTVLLDEKSRDYLCFTVNGKKYRPLRAPMGYKNSAQLFAAFIDHITPAHLKEKLVVYVDDLLIVGTHESIRELTREVIKELGEYGILFSLAFLL